MKLSLKQFYIILGVAVVILIGILVWVFVSGDKDKPKSVEESWSSAPYDPNFMPTTAQLNEIMSEAEDDMYPEGYRNNVDTEDKPLYVPGTNISFRPFDMLDSICTVAFTLMALESNPYAVTDTMPFAFLKESGEQLSESEKTLPNGTRVDLSTLKEDYTQLRFDFNRANLKEVTISGLRNDKPFEKDVDLTYIYKEYYTKD